MGNHTAVQQSAWEADRTKQTHLVDHAFDQKVSNLVFELEDETGLDLELLSSCYLLTNAYLMGRMNRGCLKLFAFKQTDPDLLAASENYLRALLGDEFSALSNLSNWIKIIEAYVGVPEEILFYAKQTVSALSSFDARQQGHLSEPADVVLATTTPASDARVTVEIENKELELRVLDRVRTFPVFRQARGETCAWALCEDSACYFFKFDKGNNRVFAQSWLRFLRDVDLTWRTQFARRD